MAVWQPVVPIVTMAPAKTMWSSGRGMAASVRTIPLHGYRDRYNPTLPFATSTPVCAGGSSSGKWFSS